MRQLICVICRFHGWQLLANFDVTKREVGIKRSCGFDVVYSADPVQGVFTPMEFSSKIGPFRNSRDELTACIFHKMRSNERGISANNVKEPEVQSPSRVSGSKLSYEEGLLSALLARGHYLLKKYSFALAW